MVDTKTIETPVDKHKVELKCWLTGRDRRTIDSAIYGDIEIGMKGKEAEVNGLKGSLYDKAQDKMIEVMVVSIDGIKENVLNTILDMKEEDFDFVINVIKEITEKKTQ